MPKHIAERIITTTAEVPLAQAFIDNPGATINLLLKMPGFVAIVTSVGAFLLIRLWDLIRGHTRLTAEQTVMHALQEHNVKQMTAYKIQEDKVVNLMVEVVKMSHQLDKIDIKFSHYEKRIDKIEGDVHDLSR